jgi:glycine hydroxymethyltransferase
MASLRTVCRAPLSQLARRTAATNHPRILQRQWRGYATSLEAQQKVLSQDLEDADPTVYKIIEQVRLTPPSSHMRLKLIMVDL